MKKSLNGTLDRIRSEFIEMPGMRLTGPQVERLCGVDAAVCQQVLSELVETRFLTYHPDGVYTRLTLEMTAMPVRGARRA